MEIPELKRRATMRNVALAMLLCAGAVRASLIYEFTYTQTSGSIQGFSIFFVAPGFLGGTSPETPITPVTVTDGVTDWPIAKYRPFNIIGPECYLFGTESVALNTCGVPTTNSVAPPDGSFQVIFLGNPFTTGTFVPDYFDGFFLGGAGGTISSSTGAMSLRITNVPAVPEPSSAVFLGLGLAALGLAGNRRLLGCDRFSHVARGSQ
jgi:hypothetical protein